MKSKIEVGSHWVLNYDNQMEEVVVVASTEDRVAWRARKSGFNLQTVDTVSTFLDGRLAIQIEVAPKKSWWQRIFS